MKLNFVITDIHVNFQDSKSVPHSSGFRLVPLLHLHGYSLAISAFQPTETDDKFPTSVNRTYCENNQEISQISPSPFLLIQCDYLTYIERCGFPHAWEKESKAEGKYG